MGNQTAQAITETMGLVADLNWQDVRAINQLIGWAAEGLVAPLDERDLSHVWSDTLQARTAEAARDPYHPSQLVTHPLLQLHTR